MTTCSLRAFLGTNLKKPEEGAVAVLAAAMRTSREFSQEVVALADGKDVGGDATLTVGTEQATFVGLQHVDLEVVVSEPRRRHVQRIWIEAKLTSPLARGEEHQLVRYHRALGAVDHRQRHQPMRRLGVLVRRRQDLRPADWTAIRTTGASVIVWQQIADAAWRTGAASADHLSWRARAREPDAPLSVANLDTLLWYLQSKDLRVHTDPPLLSESVQHYENAVQVGKAVAGLARLIAERLGDHGWPTTLDRPGSEEPLTFASKPIRLPSPVPWWQRKGARQADLWFQISPYDPRDQTARASVWVGLGFAAPMRPTEEWIAELRAVGFEPEEEDTGSGLLDWVGAFEPLDTFVGPDKTAGSQAADIAQWIAARVDELARIGRPPSRAQSVRPAPNG